jgi:hypothetical protein
MNFPDPTIYPIVFLPKEKETIFLAIKEFPVSFTFDTYPRQAIMNSMVVEQLETFFISQDIYKDESVAIFNKNVGSKIELLATDRNITKTDFILKSYINKNEFKAIKSGQLQIVNQPTGIGENIEHLFVMTSSTMSFDAYNDDGDYYYPTATLKLIFYPYVKNTSYVWADITLPDQLSTPVVIAPINSYGLLDVLAEVKINWYLDPERTSPTSYIPFIMDNLKFGIRFCISNKGSLFKNAVQLGLTGNSQGTAIATSLYSTSTLHDFDPYVYHNIFYWGSGELKTDLFYSKVDNIEIANNGLPIQLGVETAAYILDNPLPDIYFSSSSCSSISSFSTSSLSSSSLSSLSSDNSSASSSSSSSSSSMSTTSLSSSSSTSSLSSLEVTSSSSQSPSSATSISSSSSGAFAYSSSSSSSSSTQIANLSSSSSSIEARVVLYYGFKDKYDTLFMVEDESENGHTAAIGGTSPIVTWSNVDGIHGGRYIYSPSGNHVQYISSTNITDFSYLNRGTISFWAKISDVSLLTSSSLFTITNGAVEDKTELIIGLSIGVAKEIIASISIDGEIKWALNAVLSTAFVGNWYNFVIVQDGSSPSLYINGLPYAFTFSVPDYKSFWINSLFSFSTISKAQQLMLGTTLRNYFPYKVLGFSGELDEIKIWDTNLSADMIYQEYLKIKGIT